MKPGRFKKAEIYLTVDVRLALQQIAQVQHRDGKRARAIMLSAEGLSNKAIGQKLGLSRQTIGAWRNAFLERGLSGLRDKSFSRKYPCKTLESTPIERTRSAHRFSLSGLRPHRIGAFNLHALLLSGKRTVSQWLGAFNNLPGRPDEKEPLQAAPHHTLERIIRVGSLFAGKCGRPLRRNQVRDTLNKCFRLTRELEILDASGIPYVLNDSVLSVRIHLPGRLNVHFWPTSGKWIDYLNPRQRPHGAYGTGASAVIKYYQQRCSSRELPVSREGQKIRRQKAALEKRRQVEDTIRLLTTSGVAYYSKNNGYYIGIKGPGQMRIELWPSTGYWKIVGDRKRYCGTPCEFLDWYMRIANLQKQPGQTMIDVSAGYERL